MALEIARSANAIYRINPAKRTEIQTRKAAPRSRWRFFRVYDSAETAAREMLRLGSRAHGAPQQGVASPRPVAPGLPQMTNPYQALTYADYLQTAHWRETRKRKLMAVGCKCARCDNYRGLEVHHLTYERLGAERMDDLEVLCPDCHRKAHGAAWPGGGPGSPRTGANGEKVK